MLDFVAVAFEPLALRRNERLEGGVCAADCLMAEAGILRCLCDFEPAGFFAELRLALRAARHFA